MDETFFLILHACKLAGELETHLQNIGNQPHFLLSSCEGVAGAFDGAIHALRSRTSPSRRAAAARMIFGEALGPRIDMGLGEGSSRGGGGRMPAMDVLRPRTSGTEMGPPELGLAASAGVGSMGFGTDGGTLAAGSVGDGVAAAEGLPGSGRRPAGSSVQRASRKRRKDASVVDRTRMPAPSTGNMEIPPDDGHTWRKYGQKAILGARFPRSYYRCTHKSFYGCGAKKQVQRLDDDPYTYEVTYCGSHTCQTSTTPLVIQSLPPTDDG